MLCVALWLLLPISLADQLSENYRNDWSKFLWELEITESVYCSPFDYICSSRGYLNILHVLFIFFFYLGVSYEIHEQFVGFSP